LSSIYHTYIFRDMSCDSSLPVPTAKVDCAFNVDVKLSNPPKESRFFEAAIADYSEVESDPFASAHDPVDGDLVEPVLDAIFKTSREVFLKNPATLSKPAAIRRNKKQKQKDSSKPAIESSKQKDLNNNPVLKPDIKSKGQRKTNLIRQKEASTTKKYLGQISRTEFEPVHNDRRLYGADSFNSDIVLPVKVIQKEEVNETSDFKVNSHHMLRNHTDGSAFLYGTTIKKQFSDIEKSDHKISKTQAKKQRCYLSKANFSYDLAGNPISKNLINKMNSKEDLSLDNNPTVQQENLSSSIEQSHSDREELLQQQIAEQRARVVQQKESYISARLPETQESSSQVEEFNGSYNPHNGIPTIDNEIENMEIPKNQEIVPESRLNETSETLAAIQALSAQIANLTTIVSQQAEELKNLRQLLAERDREIEELKQPKVQNVPTEEIKEPVPEVLPIEIKKVEIVPIKEQLTPLKADIPPQEKSQPSTSKVATPLAKEEPQPSTSKDEFTTVKSKKFSRAKSSPLITRFKDDGINKQLDISTAQTPKEKLDVIKNNITLTDEQKKKVTGQGIRAVNAEPVKEKTFAEKLAQGLQRSKSTIRYSPKQVSKPLPPRPKAIQEKTWSLIVKATPETLENWEAKRKVKVFEQYKKLFYAQHARLTIRWQEAMVKHKLNLKNDWLQFPGRVLALLRAEELDAVPQAIQTWRNKAATYVPKNGNINADWASSPATTTK